MNNYFKKSIIVTITSIAVLGLYFSITSFFINNKKEDSLKEQSSREVLIAENKISLVPIILPEVNTPLMKEAANDLASYIEKISGAKPDIIIGEPTPIPASAIWVGYQPALDKLFPNIKFNYAHPEEVINTGNDKHIAITGRDVWNPDVMSVPDRTGKTMIHGIQQEYGTCNAVYTFLQDQLGVRWFWPGPDGEDFIKKEKLGIKPFTYRYHPVIRDRSGILHLTRIISNKNKGDEHKWARLQRMQLSSFSTSPGSAFNQWWAKYGKTNPELFALLPDGKREPKFKPEDVKLCQSNPEVWNKWLLDVEAKLKDDPNATVFSASANDGWSHGHCTCNNCRAWDLPEFTWSNPILSDREVRFANALSAKLKENFPGKPYWVLITGYGYTRPAATTVKPNDNVIILSISNFLQRADGFEDGRTLAMKQYADWGKVTPNLAWKPNIGNPAGQILGMPDISPHQASEDFKFVADNGCLGLFFDAYWNHWSTQSIQYYSYAQLAWNPYLNIDSLLDDYHTRAYGPAAGEMKAYWELMEDTRNSLMEKVKTRARYFRSPEVYTPDFFKKAEGFLASAKAKLKTADPKFSKRLHFTECGFELTKLIIETRILNQAWEKNKKDEKIMKEIDINWAKAKAMRARFPKYAINFNKTFNNPKATAMDGLHYLHPVTDKTLRRVTNIPGYE